MQISFKSNQFHFTFLLHMFFLFINLQKCFYNIYGINILHCRHYYSMLSQTLLYVKVAGNGNSIYGINARCFYNQFIFKFLVTEPVSIKSLILIAFPSQHLLIVISHAQNCILTVLLWRAVTLYLIAFGNMGH